MHKQKLVVIGGGAAGFFCAVNAARINPALEVTIIEKSSKLLGKVKVSGGGRCNVTHACFSIADMIKKYPRGNNFLKKAFHHFFTTDTINWFKERNVELKTEADGRMFPVTDSSQTIIECLMKEANKYGVTILMNAEVRSIIKEASGFSIHLANEKKIPAGFICIASGGYPKSSQFEWLRQIGHAIEDPVPSLFTFNMPGNIITGLMGLSVDNVVVKINGTKLTETGPVLITHWGLSGPAVLKLSAWGARILQEKNYSFSITVNWLPAFTEQSLRERFQRLRFDIATQKLINRNPFFLPQRLWEYFLSQSGIAAGIRWADLPAKEQNKLIKHLCAQEFSVHGKTTFKEEFVTCGGIKLEEIDVNTMQSKIVPGLFFAGEVLNADGVTGGFNFQNAWTTGWIAAKGIVQANKVDS
ncbi:MAG: NAD(P)/FAD-dependent oxidoreductase [Ferruginibacter sp.]